MSATGRRSSPLAVAATAGSTIHNTAATRLMAIGELQVNTVAVARVALVAQDALVVLAEPVALGSPAVPVALLA